jgi:hypothetical protein
MSGHYNLGAPAEWPSGRRWLSKKRRLAIGSSVAVLALVLTGRFASSDADASSPATHTEPPAGVLAGLQVAGMPTLNS